MQKGEVTVVITSCARFDLLEATLRSFFSFNTYPIAKFIITEDSGDRKGIERVLARFPSMPVELIVNEVQLGQLRSIDLAYSRITTEYIFHCEDDWEFLRRGFIEDSMALMDKFPTTLTVWLRSIDEFPSDLFATEVQTFETLSYREVTREIFTFNPSLKRLSDYHLVNNYSHFTPGKFESELSDFYAGKDFKSFILLQPAVTHLGWHRRVHFREKENKFLKLDNLFKRLKASIYRFFKMGKFKK